jgi:hypothetical protein
MGPRDARDSRTNRMRDAIARCAEKAVSSRRPRAIAPRGFSGKPGTRVSGPGPTDDEAEMANVVVVGAQWGDEGKGKIVDWLSSGPT